MRIISTECSSQKTVKEQNEVQQGDKKTCISVLFWLWIATFVRSFLAFSNLSISIFWAFAEKEQKLQEALETVKSHNYLAHTLPIASKQKLQTAYKKHYCTKLMI